MVGMEDKSPYSFEEVVLGLDAAWLALHDDISLAEFQEAFFKAIEDMRESDNYDDPNLHYNIHDHDTI